MSYGLLESQLPETHPHCTFIKAVFRVLLHHYHHSHPNLHFTSIKSDSGFVPGLWLSMFSSLIEQAARMKKMQEEEKRKKAEFRKKVGVLWCENKHLGMRTLHDLMNLFLMFGSDGEGRVWFYPGQQSAEEEVCTNGEDREEHPVSQALPFLFRVSILLELTLCVFCCLVIQARRGRGGRSDLLLLRRGWRKQICDAL